MVVRILVEVTHSAKKGKSACAEDIMRLIRAIEKSMGKAGGKISSFSFGKNYPLTK